MRRTTALVLLLVVLIAAIVFFVERRPAPISTTTTTSSEVLLIPNGTSPVKAVSRSVGEMMASYYIGDGYVMITPYPWNMKAWSGEIVVEYNGSALRAFVDAKYSQKFNPYAPVLGYPSARYGCDPLFGACTTTRPPLALPTPALNANALMTLEYAVSPGNCDVTDFSYDIWLTKGPGLGPGDLELMLWMYYTTPLTKSAPSPYWTPAGIYEIPVYINGARVDMPIEAFLHVDSSSWSVLILAFKEPVRQGSVAVNLRDLMEIAKRALNGTSIDLGELKLTSIDVGIEFDGPPGVELTCSYEIYKWALSAG